MRRREFIALVGSGVAAAWPLAAFGKTQRIATVAPVWINDSLDQRREPRGPAGFFNNTSDFPFVKAFFNELRHAGFVEGQNLLIERYSGEGRAKHYPEFVR